MSILDAAHRYLDARSMISLFLLATAVPSYLVVTVVGSVGRPSILVCLVMLAWWLAHQLRRPFGARRELQPLRWMLATFVFVVVASYIRAMLGGLPLPEVSPADNGLLRALAWCGIFLVAHDGLRTPEALISTIRRVVIAGELMALLGLMQFITKDSLLGWLSIPGMSGDYFGGVGERAGFARASGTAMHALEYGAVLCTTLPLSLALAMSDRSRTVIARWTPAMLITAACLLSVSRSALIAVVVSTAVLALSWNLRQKVYGALLGAALLVVLYVTVPGMAGTIIGMFSGAAGDSSIASRVNGYDLAFGMAGRQPLLGRGFGTLLPSYVYLDNQYLGIIVELGMLGLIVVLALFLGAISHSWRSRRFARSEADRAIGAAIAAAICAAATSFAFFDALSFPLSATFMFLMLGMAGAYRRLMREGLGDGAYAKNTSMPRV